MADIKTIKIDDKEYVLRSDVETLVRKERKGAWMVGEKYLIRTVTMMDVGILLYVDDHELVLADASWIADSGRFNEFLSTGKPNECEPFPGEAIIGRGAIVDSCIWTHALPRSVK